MPGLPRRFWEYVSRSTLKREAASFLMFWLMSLASIAFYMAPSYRDKLDLIEAFKWPVMFGFFGAFGLDWMSKQSNIAGPPMGMDPAAKVENEIEVPTVTTITTKAADKPDGE